MTIPFFLIFVILAFVLMHRIRYVKHQEEKANANFWETEAKADQVRKQDLSGLTYVFVPIELLPFGVDSSEESIRCEQELIKLDKLKILNLNQYTNTELKLQYGAANLPYLSECDEHFLTLSRTLYEWANILLNHNYVDEAIYVAEYSLSTGADISGIFYMLADYYKQVEDEKAMLHLLDKANAITGLNAAMIQNYVKDALGEITSDPDEMTSDPDGLASDLDGLTSDLDSLTSDLEDN